MTQGRPHDKTLKSVAVGHGINRRADTLHILTLLLRKQALAREDTATVELIDHVLAHLRDGDSIKIWIMDKMKESER
jgi:hypothetical protein